MGEGQRMMGWCKRTGAWVSRDAMLGLSIKVFGADGAVDQFTIRLHPEAHAALAAELRGLAWDNRMRTRADLEAEGAPIAEVTLAAPTDTASWYAAQDERLVTRAVLRPAARARTMQDLWRIVMAAAARVAPNALWEVLAEERGRLPRWDAGVVDLASYDGETVLALSADDGEVLVLERSSGGVRAALVEHDSGEAVARARGALVGEPPSLTR